MAFETTTELAVLAEKELGHQLTGSSSQRADIVSHLDRANKIVFNGGGLLNYNEKGEKQRDEIVFAFARSPTPLILTLRPAITSVNVTATLLSNAITFDAAPDGANSVSNWYIRIDGGTTVYRIASHVAASTSAVLDGDFVGVANVAVASCSIFKLQYDIGANTISQILSPIAVYSKVRNLNNISITDKDELLKQYPLSDVYQSFPTFAAIVKESDGTLTLQFNSYPDNLERIELDYIPVQATLDTNTVNTTIPKPYRATLAYLAAYLMAARNNDSRALNFLQIARDMFSELVQWNERLMSTGDDNYGRVVIRGFNNPPMIKVQRGYTLAG